MFINSSSTLLIKISMLENYKSFLDKIFSNLKNAGFRDEEFIEIDHIAYRTETFERYTELKDEFEKISSNSYEAIISGRPIMVYRLKEPLIYENWKVEGLELCAPKEGSFYSEGLEHAEFVTRKSLEEFRYDHENVDFNMKAYSKEDNPELILDFKDCAVKFHTQSLLKIRNL